MEEKLQYYMRTGREVVQMYFNAFNWQNHHNSFFMLDMMHVCVKHC